MPKYRGVHINIEQYAKIYGLHPSTLRSRIERNVPLEKLYAPPKTLAKRLHERHPAEYRVWSRIRHQIKHSASRRTMTPRWDDFAYFLLDVGPRPSPKHQLRLKNPHSTEYNPETVHWVLPKPKPKPQRKARRKPQTTNPLILGQLTWLMYATPEDEEE